IARDNGQRLPARQIHSPVRAGHPEANGCAVRREEGKPDVLDSGQPACRRAVGRAHPQFPLSARVRTEARLLAVTRSGKALARFEPPALGSTDLQPKNWLLPWSLARSQAKLDSAEGEPRDGQQHPRQSFPEGGRRWRHFGPWVSEPFGDGDSGF